MCRIRRTSWQDYVLIGIFMRRARRTTFGRIGCAGVVVALACARSRRGLHEVNARSIGGASPAGVDQ
jgi:hypothetical protein